VLLLQLLHYLEQRLRLCDVVPVPAPLLENGPLPLEEFPAIGYMALGLLQVIEVAAASSWALVFLFFRGKADQRPETMHHATA
jgi:hypothetical protein